MAEELRIVYLKEFGSWYTVEDGTIMQSPHHPFQEPGVEWNPVTAPQMSLSLEHLNRLVDGEERGNHFLSRINKAFGTNYTLDQFDGR